LVKENIVQAVIYKLETNKKVMKWKNYSNLLKICDKVKCKICNKKAICFRLIYLDGKETIIHLCKKCKSLDDNEVIK